LIIALFQDPIMAIWVSIITLVAQQTDANLITPNIMGKTLNIHPLTIITILSAAGNIAGVIGILLAVPGYAVGKAVISNIYKERKKLQLKPFKSMHNKKSLSGESTISPERDLLNIIFTRIRNLIINKQDPQLMLKLAL